MWKFLKQNLFSPMTVENQVAIIYCGTQGLLRNVPVDKIRDFQTDYIHHLETTQAETHETDSSR